MTTNDMTNWPNVAPSGTPIVETVNNGSVVKNMDGAEKPEGFFSQPSNVLPAVIPPERDEKGRFLTGNNGGGRKRGSRNKLTELFLNTIVEDFAEHGTETLERLRKEDPGFYLKMIAVLIPKSLIHQIEVAPDVDYANMTDSEVMQLLDELKRKRMIEAAIEVVSR